MTNRIPTIVINTPVAAVRQAPSEYHCANGKRTTAIRTE
jgi:hypothetical protein